MTRLLSEHSIRQLPERADALLRGIGAAAPKPGTLVARTPITGDQLGTLRADTVADADQAIERAATAFRTWRSVPAPQRAAVVRRLAELLSLHHAELAELVTLETGKIGAEAAGEVQEMIDICEFAVGLSRQLYGRTMPSERPGHRLMETWHPLGVVGVVSAFNFPVAVWSWNTAIALVCGNTVVWKPSERTPLTALACHTLLRRAAHEVGADPQIHQLLLGDAEVGARLVDDERVALLSATGSVPMGRAVAPRVAARFGRCLLELGGNNGAIVTPSADVELAARAIVFAAAGTAGQRCTTLRRLIVHADIAGPMLYQLEKAYLQLRVGNPLERDVLIGPLLDGHAYERMRAAIARAIADGGELLCGGERVDGFGDEAFYVRPAIVRMPAQTAIVREETFAPILYVLTYRGFDAAIELHNAVPQGLSSAVFTTDQREAERFLAAEGSDCGIANVNIGTSGAEIGGAFGGEKHTGGGRESGSDAWKAYMRRATNTINYSDELPLAQGIRFG
ncbi:L-piperidine-6-carboxylate dehydrogenase [Nocardia donostiensis]|uniref:Aldehyde dehydrogenase family protein n=1 Tax=Nocardia donostiensis TaxID=1538463 RepID=A0A1W0AWL6_9NOCA|nr:aldehyde dehydrogenase family protein [Nocardia donostiensis]ONM47023.1 aldehyde dehydrogenase family protein [Nocardia donostiensis]OQS14605.1 aldehyde dehydrogenase family protein [Nocardia donostiensis]OQS18773.1 aldehyde dehydrogenase family protein [Nocardia donostiensis]